MARRRFLTQIKAKTAEIKAQVKTQVQEKISVAKEKTKRIKAATKEAVTKLKKVVKVASFAPLLILRAPMIILLKKKGVTPKQDIGELAVQFHSVIIKDQPERLDMIPPEAIEAVVSLIPVIINFFKKMKAKKQAGEKLTTAEENALSAAETAANAITEAAEEQTTAGVFKGVTKFIPIIALGAIVVYFVTKK